VTRPIGFFWSPRRGHTDVSEYEQDMNISLNTVLRRTVDNRDRAQVSPHILRTICQVLQTIANTIPLNDYNPSGTISGIWLQRRFRTTCRSSDWIATCPLLFWLNWHGVYTAYASPPSPSSVGTRVPRTPANMMNFINPLRNKVWSILMGMTIKSSVSLSGKTSVVRSVPMTKRGVGWVNLSLTWCRVSLG
jgi:hypothetical protein